MPSELVWVALIAAVGPIIGFFAKPIGDAVTGWLQAGQRRREQQAAAVRAAQDALAQAIEARLRAQYGNDIKAAKAMALTILPMAERIHDAAAREAVKAFVTTASGDVDVDDVRDAYHAANDALGEVSRR
jgi:hypothetical protein